MKRPNVWLFLFLSFFGLFTFQNCGKFDSNQSLDQASMSQKSLPGEMMEKQIIVKMNSAEAHQKMSDWAENNGLFNLNTTDSKSLADWNSKEMSVWGWDGPLDVQELKNKLMLSMGDEVEYAEPNYMFQEAARTITDIPLNQQILTNANPYASQLEDLQANLTPLTAALKRPIVAVIDSGLDTSHLAFQRTNALWVNIGETGTDDNGANKRTNGVDDDGNGYVDDVHGYNFKDRNTILTDSTGHGTHCAGIVLGVGQNIFDLNVDLTTNPERTAKIQIMALKFIGPNGGATSDAINAIFYAVRNGAKVLSNSWGGPTYSRALEDAIAFAYNEDRLFVAAAGNAASNNDSTPVYPANYKLPNVISVAASDGSDRLASFSNFGIGSVDIAAPGVSVLSTFPKAVSESNSTMYEYLSGTSMATPMVSGIAALALYENEAILPFQLKQIIVNGADQASALNNILINPARANPVRTVADASVAVPATSKPEVVRTPSSVAAAESQQQAGAGCGMVAKIVGENFPPSPPPFAPLVLLFLPLMLAFRFRFAT